MKESIFFIFFIVTTCKLMNKVDGKPAGNYGSITLPDELARVRKRNENTASYLEQCGIVDFKDTRSGLVNVLAFLDSSWPYSHRQAVMLNILNQRLQNSGLRDTVFFLVNIDPQYRREIVGDEEEIEKEAWLGVSPEEIEEIGAIDTSFDSLTKNINGTAGIIHFIQDDEYLGIWRRLGGSRDQVLVIDRCGKLTYQVIIPWSILHFPYVKAAILSTYNDAPCGLCDRESRNETRDTSELLDLVEASSDYGKGSLADVKDAVTLDAILTESGDTELGLDELWTTSTSKIIEDTTKAAYAEEVTEEVMGSTLSILEIQETATDRRSVEEESTSTLDFESTIVNLDAMDTTAFYTSTMDEELATTQDGAHNHVDSDDFEVKNSSLSTTQSYEAASRNSVESVIDESPEILPGADTGGTRHFVDPRGTSKMADEIEQRKDYDATYVPIRIIMHAPHFHVDTDSTRMHEYLVFKTGSTGTHGHLASGDATRLFREPQDYQETRNSTSREIEEKEWPMKSLIYGKDESTGLFGEVADYWRDLANPENYEDEDDDTERPDYRVNGGATDGELWKQPSPQMDAGHSDASETTKMEQKTELFNSGEDETRHELIAHYSKLLPWIYYVLDE